MNKYQHLQQLYYSLPQHLHPVHFHNMAIRDLDHQGRLERPFFALAATLASEANLTNQSYTIMVTASHNPPGYNGLKVDALFANLKLNEGLVTQSINNTVKTIDLIHKLCTDQFNRGAFYIGRDKRPTSSRLSSIIKDVLKTLGRHVVDLGERSTPEMFSLSQYLHQKHLNGQSFEPTLVNSYFQVIKQSFCTAMDLISTNLNKKWKKKHLCLDFGNGVGGQSLKDYAFLDDFFAINVTNFHNFNLPNHSCGAEWFYKYYKDHEKIPALDKYPKAQEYYFYDGDSDRIIGQMSHQHAPTDGDDFNACFISLLRSLLDSISMKEQQLGSVGNITSNEALGKFMKTLRAGYKKVPVGVRHLFAQVKKHDLGCYFENSGHGCLYFSKQMLEKIMALRQKHWQADLLLMLNELSRNNSRGYALHNMLIFQIYLYYFGTQTGLIFEKSFILNKEYQLQKPQLFINGKTGLKLLQKPQQIIEFLKEIQSVYCDQHIIIRKSMTSPIVKLTIQGNRINCEKITNQFEKVLKIVQNQAN